MCLYVEYVNSKQCGASKAERAGPTNSSISKEVMRGQLTPNCSPAACYPHGLTALVVHCKTYCCCL